MPAKIRQPSLPERESYLPFRVPRLVDACIRENKLTPSQVDDFRKFATILAALVNFQFYTKLDDFKNAYADYNPDADMAPDEIPTTSAAQVFTGFQRILERANYKLLPEQVLKQALKESSLIKLNTYVDMSDFERILCYYRGDGYETYKTPKFLSTKRFNEKKVNVFERVALLVQFREGAENPKLRKKRKRKMLRSIGFKPGKVYLYFYKNIPKQDLELLFPNVSVEMNFIDKLLFGLPASATFVLLVSKVLPQLLIILAAILFYTAGEELMKEWTGKSADDLTNISPLLAALLGVALAFWGFAFNQYNSFTKKRLRFQKLVTDTLFFRNLDTNLGVVNRLVDIAQEEETKEMILVYYHLLTSPRGLTAKELDERIEQWTQAVFGRAIDFDIDGPLGNLRSIRAAGPDGAALLNSREDGTLQVLPVDGAKALIDHVWDHLYEYSAATAK